MNTVFDKLARQAVLIVEDDYTLASELASKLSQAGINVVGPAPNVEQALKYIEDSKIEVAILDINLGGAMVFPVADELSRRNIPFFFATGYSRDVVPPRFADRIFVEKPLDTSAIYGALSTCRNTTPKPADGQRNLVLSALSSREIDLVRPLLQPIRLAQGEVLEQQFGEITTVFFIESGTVSVVASAPTGPRVEVGLIGREGLTGSGLLEGDWRTPYDLVVLTEGSAQRIDIDGFLRLMQRAPQLRSLASSFSRTLAIQIGYTALANSRYSIEQRLARLLLMLNDRSEDQLLLLTHEHMSSMLGVRRSGVTSALPILEGEKLIRSVRGKVIVVDREGLVVKANGSYGIPEAEYERVMGFSLRGTGNAKKPLGRPHFYAPNNREKW
ncbi:response regulator protein (plasmid) [Rhizobium sp. NXC14]|uniref:helix-turn-helix domain-containing protein n=1 Tax=Rhizobium sp. NXC14 TaxID=1981173 RepID=UPI000A20BDB3|nr:helix-turn-helix domain-containing protein [Rhizobium sp. NXC14]ARO33746.1 response regulator protein [Rhizobium sp. NXC14]